MFSCEEHTPTKRLTITSNIQQPINTGIYVDDVI